MDTDTLDRSWKKLPQWPFNKTTCSYVCYSLSQYLSAANNLAMTLISAHRIGVKRRAAKLGQTYNLHLISCIPVGKMRFHAQSLVAVPQARSYHEEYFLANCVL
jgi:hypothetical protein